MGVEVLLHVFLVTVGNGDVVVAEDNTETIHKANLGHVHDVGAVRAHELRGGETLFYAFHIHQAENGLLVVLKVYLHVVFQTFDEQNVIVLYLDKLVLTLHKDETVGSGCVYGRLRLKPLQSLVCSEKEGLVADGLQQVVQRINLVAVNGILAESGSEDDAGGLGDDGGELNAAEFGHLDVEKHEMNTILTQVLDGRYGTVVGADEVEERGLLLSSKMSFSRQKATGLP